MDRQVLSDPAVAGCLNDRFVPLRVDVNAESSAELLRRFGLDRGAPVFLVLSEGGEVLDRFDGFIPREEFLGLLRDALAGNHFVALEQRAARGEESYDFLLAYGRRLHHRCAPEAAEVLRRAVALDPEEKRAETIDAEYVLARIASGGDMVHALAAFVAAHPNSSHAVEAHTTLALLYGAGEPDKAIASFEFLRSHGALDKPWQKHDYARLLAWNGRDLETALSLVGEALRAVPDEPRWLDTKAECLSRLGRYDEAITVESRAIGNSKQLEDRREFERALYEMKKRRDDAAR